MNQSKKLIIIILVVAFVIAVGAGVYFGFQKSKDYINPISGQGGTFPAGEQTNGFGSGNISKDSTDQNDEESEIIREQKQRLLSLSLGSVVDYWIASSTATASSSTLLASDIFYLNDKGDIVKVDGIGKETNVVSSSFGKPMQLVQNVSGSRVAVKFNSGKYAIFDLKSKAWQELESDILSVSFSPDGNRIAYLKDGDRKSIYIKDLSKSKSSVTLVASLAVQDFGINWIENNKILLVPKQSADFIGQAWFVNLSSKTLGYFGGGKGFGVSFSYPYNFGIKMINQTRSVIVSSLIDKSGNKLADVPLATVADKCSFAFDEKNLFCAVAYENNKDSGLTLPDDYLKNGVNFKDKLYKIDIETSDIEIVFDLNNTVFDMSKIKSRSDQVFFVNKYDGKLYMYNMR